MLEYIFNWIIKNRAYQDIRVWSKQKKCIALKVCLRKEDVENQSSKQISQEEKEEQTKLKEGEKV